MERVAARGGCRREGKRGRGEDRGKRLQVLKAEGFTMLGRGGARGRRRRCEKLHGECCRDLCPALPPSPAFPSANKPPPAQDSDRFSPAILPTLPIAIMMQSLQRAMAHRMHGSKSHCDCPLVLYASSSVPSTPQKLRRQIGQLTRLLLPPPYSFAPALSPPQSILLQRSIDSAMR